MEAVGVLGRAEDGLDGAPGGGLDGGVDVAAVEASVSVDVAGEFDDAELGDAGDVGGDGAFGDAEVVGDLGAGAAVDAHRSDALEAVANTRREAQRGNVALVTTGGGGSGHMRIIVRDMRTVDEEEILASGERSSRVKTT